MTEKANKQDASTESKKESQQPDAAVDEKIEQQTTETLDKGDCPDYASIIKELNDKVLRSAAEVQNIRRRADQDVQKARSFSIESFAKDLLGVMDNLYRAADSVSEEEAEKDEKLKAIRDGVEITKKEMLNVFERNKIKIIDPLGQKFDHNLHQAMSQIDDKDQESGTIINVMQTGYIIKDRLIRPALVVVVK